MPIDPILLEWRTTRAQWLASVTDDDMLARAKAMPSHERVSEWEKYRQIKAQGGEKLAILENKWIITLLSADRSDAVRARSESSKEAKKANGAAKPAQKSLSLDDLM